MEQIIKISIYIHAFFGGVGLISGFGSVLVKKGSTPHKILGNLFFIGMFLSSFISLPIACMPNHENPFLFLIGLFTIYLLLIGKRTLKYKPIFIGKVALIDRLISSFMLLLSTIMIVLGVYFLVKGKAGFLFVFFGCISGLNAITDFRFYKTFRQKKNGWLQNHVGKMVGAFIASITAFIVAGLSVGSVLAWVLPSVLGGFYINFWTRKLKK